jgi:glycine cleavage system transcriptional repressor
VPHVALTAVGVDRSGIVAAVTRVLVEQGCNLEDASMTILRGQFAMMLVIDLPSGLSVQDLEAALAAPAADCDLTMTVRPIGEPVGAPAGGDPWTVSVYGSDHPGIVHGVATLLADRGVNIVDLTTRVAGPPGEPVYAMVLEVAVPADVDPAGLEHDLGERARELGVEVSLHRSDADIL